MQNCIGKQLCSVTVAPEVFGGDPCPGNVKKLSVEAICSQHKVASMVSEMEECRLHGT